MVTIKHGIADKHNIIDFLTQQYRKKLFHVFRSKVLFRCVVQMRLSFSSRLFFSYSRLRARCYFLRTCAIDAVAPKWARTSSSGFYINKDNCKFCYEYFVIIVLAFDFIAHAL